jgi:hypothetical protein
MPLSPAARVLHPAGAPADHRRVLAVLTYLTAVASGTG